MVQRQLYGLHPARVSLPPLHAVGFGKAAALGVAWWAESHHPVLVTHLKAILPGIRCRTRYAASVTRVGWARRFPGRDGHVGRSGVTPPQQTMRLKCLLGQKSSTTMPIAPASVNVVLRTGSGGSGFRVTNAFRIQGQHTRALKIL
jgi:hypothetical protein